MARKLLELHLRAVEFRTSQTTTFGNNSIGVLCSVFGVDHVTIGSLKPQLRNEPRIKSRRIQ